jgi:hypothetical protein
MTDLLDAALAKIKAKPEPYVFGAPSIVPKQPEPMPLFDLTKEAIDAATLAERDAIIADLKEWGMLRLPFERIAIRFPQERVANECGFTPHPELRHVCLTMWVGGEPLTVQPMYTCAEDHDPDGKPRPARQGTREQWEEEVKSGITNRRDVVCPTTAGMQVLIEGGIHNGKAHKIARMVNLRDVPSESFTLDYQCLCVEALTILLASLAARNVIKEVSYNANNQTTGDKPRFVSNGITYLSRTVIKPPRADQLGTERGGLSNGKLEIRLVRGHKRQVVADTTKPPPTDKPSRVTVVGAGRTGRREQWIAP